MLRRGGGVSEHIGYDPVKVEDPEEKERQFPKTLPHVETQIVLVAIDEERSREVPPCHGIT